MFTKYYVYIDDKTEYCYYLEHTKLLADVIGILINLLGPLQVNSCLYKAHEYGPKLNFKTSWCSNVLQVLAKCGVTGITRIEQSIRSIDILDYDSMTKTEYPAPLTDFSCSVNPEPVQIIPKEYIAQYAQDRNLGFDSQDLEYYTQEVFPDRDPTNVELYDLAQSNSEHSRHHFFSGKQIIDGQEKCKTLFQLIKETLPVESNSVLAFCDNASAIRGYSDTPIVIVKDNKYCLHTPEAVHPTFTAETHNFPTGIAPFPGAATGVGGRVRDTLAIGRGGTLIAGTAGYCVADRKMLVEASNGASDYGNKLGEPIIQGFTRFFDQNVGGERWAWLKPIMFSGGLGQVWEENLHKQSAKPGLQIVRVGGPAYRIGLGGSTASSKHQSGEKENQQAVQRGDPEMENRVYKFIRACIELPRNPIISIHDQGAGGTANVTKEIVQDVGGTVDLSKIECGDPTLSALEKWIAEYQEQMTLLAKKEDLPLLYQLAARENVPLVVFGETGNDKRIHVGEIVDLDLDKIFNTPQKVWRDKTVQENPRETQGRNAELCSKLQKVLALESVGSKRFLTTKVDRSVGGLIAQQQGVGPFDTPISDYALVANSMFSEPGAPFSGAATAIGEQPIKALLSPRTSAQLAVVEMLTNLCFVRVSDLQDVKCSVNWMWPAKLPGENAAMYAAMEGLSEYMQELGIAAHGGKDSVSMYTKQGSLIKSPRSVVVSGYVTVPDITCKVTPEFKRSDSTIIYIPLIKTGLSGTALAEAYTCVDCNDEINVPPAKSLQKLFAIVQHLLWTGRLLSGHDVSDGGLITTLVEMAIAGGIGFSITVPAYACVTHFLFSEAPGVVLEVRSVPSELEQMVYRVLGTTIAEKKIRVEHRNQSWLDVSINQARKWWEAPSSKLDRLQANSETVGQELWYLCLGEFSRVTNTDYAPQILPIAEINMGIVSDEGSNGEREMAAAFKHAGFQVFDLKTVDLLRDPGILERMRGLAFVGGFTYADVTGAARGWATVIKHNQQLNDAFAHFYDRGDTFSLGVCNGCQLMSRLGWIPKCTFTKNISRRFESRYVNVKIGRSPSIMLSGMENQILGIWVAHAEGRFSGDVPNEQTPLKYIDAQGEGTVEYPCNPNGSPGGVTAVCSADGRHLAMMPHPERCFLNWQLPRDAGLGMYGPWFQMFVNAYLWCCRN